ncbi:hypothetical protein ACSF6V_11310 [Escherichia coli]
MTWPRKAVEPNVTHRHTVSEVEMTLAHPSAITNFKEWRVRVTLI